MKTIYVWEDGDRVRPLDQKYERVGAGTVIRVDGDKVRVRWDFPAGSATIVDKGLLQPAHTKPPILSGEAVRLKGCGGASALFVQFAGKVGGRDSLLLLNLENWSYFIGRADEYERVSPEKARAVRAEFSKKLGDRSRAAWDLMREFSEGKGESKC